MINFLNRLHIIKDDKESILDYIKAGAKLVDVRSADEFQMGNAQNSINIPMQQIPARLNELDKNEKIIIFCRTGNRSDMVKEFLLNHGFETVKNGGAWQEMDKWIKKYKSKD